MEYSLYVKLADGFVLDLNITLFEMSNKHTDIELVAYVVDGQGNDMELYSETLHTKRYIDEEELDIQSHIGALLTSSASSLDILGDGLVDSFNATIED